jgi:diguanylate cyclase (GGDEF)-like protein
MKDSIVIYLALAAAALAVLGAVVLVWRTRGTFRSRSALPLAAAAIAAVVGFGAALALDNMQLFAGSAAAVLLLVAIGLLAQAGEAQRLGMITEEQRVDFISGLPNERLFKERLAAEHSRTKRTHQRYSIAVFEIDDFESLSDEDRTGGLKLLAAALQESIRNTDTLGRIGAHQVGVLLVDTTAEGGSVGCDRACERFFFQSCGHSDTAHVTRPLTVSVGIASFDEDTVDPQRVVDNSLSALKYLRDRQETGIGIYEAGETRPSDRISGAARGA